MTNQSWSWSRVPARFEEHAVELGDVGMTTQVSQHQKLLFNLLDVVGDVFQDLNGDILA